MSEQRDLCEPSNQFLQYLKTKDEEQSRIINTFVNDIRPMIHGLGVDVQNLSVAVNGISTKIKNLEERVEKIETSNNNKDNINLGRKQSIRLMWIVLSTACGGLIALLTLLLQYK